MKSATFAYYAPDTLEEALALRSEHGAASALLAGGQTLLAQLNLRLVSPAIVIDLRRIGTLAGIRPTEAGIAIGAMTRQSDAERSPLVAERCPLLVRALEHVASTAIKNRGTIGGSLADALGHGELPAAALALDAHMAVRSVRGTRSIDARDFFVGANATAIEPDEVLVEAEFPRTDADGVAFVELARRHHDRALAGVAAILWTDGEGVIRDARIALSGVADGPLRAHRAEATLVGQRGNEARFALAAHAAVEELEPPDDVLASGAYRRRVAEVLVRRALVEAAP